MPDSLETFLAARQAFSRDDLRAIRRRAGLTMQAMCDHVAQHGGPAMSVSTLSNVEHGRQALPVAVAETLITHPPAARSIGDGPGSALALWARTVGGTQESRAVLLGERLGRRVPRRTLAAWETGERACPEDVLAGVANCSDQERTCRAWP